MEAALLSEPSEKITDDTCALMRQGTTKLLWFSPAVSHAVATRTVRFGVLVKIACLGWGSLLWKSDPLVLASEWRSDGPRLPIEFCRVADGGELSTALCPGAALQTTWWAMLALSDLEKARGLLQEREQIDSRHPEWVGSLPSATPAAFADHIRLWQPRVGVDAVIWTALPPRFEGTEGRSPDPAEAVDYLSSLAGRTRTHAEDYVRRTPGSLRTANRRAIEMHLGWIPAQT
ncbi:MAG: hypothetical protein JWQ73_567 [Variovorax sp.]|nr:hypothetical protein [Variovorax sp.]